MILLLSQHFDVLMQERRNSIANALELCLSCTKPLIGSGNNADQHLITPSGAPFTNRDLLRSGHG